MVREIILRELHALENEVERVLLKWFHHYPGERPSRRHKLGIEFSINNFKITIIMGGIKLPTGTPLTGRGVALDAKQNALPDSAFQTGSCKWSVTDGSGFSVAAGASEEAFVVTETSPGSASTGTIKFDANDVNGNALPTSTLDVEFDVVAAVAVATAIVPDQTSH